MQQQIADLRNLLMEEEKIMDPAMLAAFREQLKRALAGSQAEQQLAQKLTFENLMQNPSVMATMVNNPKALMAIQDVLQRGPEAIEAYSGDSQLYEALRQLFDTK